MSDANDHDENRGLDSFTQCCKIIVDSWPATTRSQILSAHREGLYGPLGVRLFVHAFEAAIDSSRDTAIWDALSPGLHKAAEVIKFRFPGSKLTSESMDDTARMRAIFDTFARCFAHAVVRMKAIPPAPSILAEDFRRCRAIVESEDIEYNVLAPVTGLCPLHFDAEEVCNQFQIVRDHVGLSEQDIHYLDACSGTPFRRRPPNVLMRVYGMEKTGNLDALLNRAVTETLRCITAIRLATGKLVGCEVLHIIPSTGDFQLFNALGRHVQYVPEMSIHEDSDWLGTPLTDADRAAISEVQLLLAEGAAKQLRTAVYRFNSAIGRRTLEDQVIDLAIALESTLCRGNDREQLSYRFRLFGAAVLADAIGWEHSFKMLRALYNARSSIVHGGKRLTQVAKENDMKEIFADRTIADVVAEFREITRKIILDFLRRAAKGQYPDAYVQSLQQAMLATAKRSLDSGVEPSS